jgi:autotransporter translocation and assembly factor TamB
MAENEIKSANKFISFKDFTLSRNQQELSIITSQNKENNEQLGINFTNFKLATFTSLLNPDESLFNGLLQGNLVIENPFGDSGMLADFTIESLEIVDVILGNLDLKASSQNRKKYDFDLSLKGGDADLDLNGDYITAESGAQLNLDLLLNKLNVKTIEGFTENIISESEGNLSGKVKISGTTTEPKYNGIFNFNNAGLVVNRLNTSFLLSEESIKVNNEGIYFETFTINDSNKNTFALDGKIGTETIINPTFDLKLTANNFQVINSSKEDNDLFYGKVKMNADLSVKGDLNIPKVTGNLKINEDSNFTVKIPESQVEVMEREGVVIFVNRKDPDAIITRNEDDESRSAILKGYDVNTVLTVDNNTVFNIIIDERTGDNFQVSGKGDFNFGIEPNGRVILSGRYDITKGHYEASLYNLVKRRFEISPGSLITWSGDPLDATL